jgi:hypothetical protein
MLSGSSYYEEYIKKHRKVCEEEQLTNNQKPITNGGYMVDREAYIGFLELQLEKINSSTLQVQAFDGRIEQVIYF